MLVAPAQRKPALSPRDALEERIRYMDLDPNWTANDGMRLRAQWWWRFGAPMRKLSPVVRDKDPNRKLRVGYVSGDFVLHSACTVFGPIMLSHSPEFEVFSYSSTPHHLHDPSTRVFQECTKWRDLVGVPDNVVAEVIREDEIDVLIDCSGLTPNSRLPAFAMRPAPVQINAWGYVYPTGFPCYDAILSDRICIHEDERAHIERVVDLPCALYYPDRELFVEANPLPCLSAPVTFGTFNRVAKVDDKAIILWKRILDAVPGSRFVFKSGDRTLTKTHDKMRAVLGDRLVFHPPTSTLEHAAAYHLLDLNLDPIAQNGGVTSMESLWMGVPMVTLPGGQTPTRMSQSFLTVLGMEDFIAKTEDDYVRLAVEWVTSRRHELAWIRAGLRAKMRASPLNVGYVEAVERAYRMLWKEWCSHE